MLGCILETLEQHPGDIGMEDSLAPCVLASFVADDVKGDATNPLAEIS